MNPRSARLLALLLVSSALSARAARVEVTPEVISPVSSLSGAVAPSAAALSLAPSMSLTAAAAPSLTLNAAPALAPALAPSALPSAAPALKPSAAPSAGPEAKPTLIQSLSAAPALDASKLSGGGAASAAENDFNSRAQLGPTVSGGDSTGEVPAEGDGATRRGISLQPSSSKAERPSATAGARDEDGAKMSSALDALATKNAGESSPLSFAPTPASLRVLASRGGATLTRERGTDSWRLTRGGLSDVAHDFDLVVIVRRDGPSGPTPAELANSDGRDARFVLATRGGAVEWNSDLSGREVPALTAGAWNSALTRAATALGQYPRLLAARGVALETRAWARVDAAWLDAGRAPVAEGQMERTMIPAWMAEELPIVAAKVGREAPPEYRAEVLSRSKAWVYRWHSRWTYEIQDGLPDGHYDPKFGIRVMLKSDWRKLKDPRNHFRVLFAHEWTHWLQNEGMVTRRYGVETPAVAVELLRGIELVGVDGIKAGRIGIIHEGTLNAFEDGRRWARGDMSELSTLYYRGTLGGAAYEVGQIAGRPEAAWEFLNLVMAEKNQVTPREAFERVTGRKK